ncbi:uncharacterized protein EI97DRAFT_452436 [Westerdykella ornata]|uniref:CREG-like beta-barrel domain-containing protein n=1 Tax=Westerdykella ornata TaxID=318751 RepID=A0A6A6JAK6_WESOR|nr:uncharacterized protein EI97DRAFT_452436 [Westerdykella ornata]KAF2273297.1 hypothetical protein EI97DRAFT_452436 [Westerdykella ornata]
MRLSAIISLSLLSVASAIHLPPPQYIFSNFPEDKPPHHSNEPHHPNTPDAPTTNINIPTVHESAILARRILRLERLGTLSTIFPAHKDAPHQPPPSVSGVPIGMMDYFGDCEPSTGNPTILAINIATSFRNVAAGSNITLSLRWHPPHTKHYSAAAMPRFSLLGELQDLGAEDVVKHNVPGCFVKYHPDAATWLPGNPIHASRWVRLVVREIYWVGGFGNVAYIGWIPVEEWQSVTEKEIEEARLPGEKRHRWSLCELKKWIGLGEE